VEISVIMPVFNAAPYVTQAVESALAQPETAEVILVEDGSPDNSLEVCRVLAKRYDKVHLYQHAGGVNRGAGPSRNLSMEKSTAEFIAFLDADDYYLPGRFSTLRQVLEIHPDGEGAYDAVGFHVEDDAGLQRWVQAGKMPVERLTTMTERIDPGELWEALISGRSGYFHLDGLVLKRSVLEKSGYMVETLRLHQDTEFIMRVAIAARLYPGRLDEPVARE
jgi:glycosyltransferase involved in cell wall biosynthesis